MSCAVGGAGVAVGCCARAVAFPANAISKTTKISKRLMQTPLFSMSCPFTATVGWPPARQTGIPFTLAGTRRQRASQQRHFLIGKNTNEGPNPGARNKEMPRRLRLPEEDE